MFRLRELNRSDIEEINKWRNNNELIDFLGAPFRYINLDVDNDWYDSYMKNRNTTVRCAIVSEENENKILGLVSLTNINYLNQSAIFHIMIGNEEYQGKGIGTFATKEILNHAFKNLNINRIELSVIESNIRAIKLYEKVGFIREGTKRKSIFKNGEFIDVVMMSVLRDEYIFDR